ncbi:hypothetical protein [Microvirga vignae]|nr:hypothetical protein [Microvirga vignae]
MLAGKALAIPKVADFTRIDAQAAYTLSNALAGLKISANAATQADRPMLIAKALPTPGGAFTAEVKYKAVMFNRSFNGIGLAIRDSATGRVHYLGLNNNGTNVGPLIQTWTTIATWAANGTSLAGLFCIDAEWMRLRSDGTTLFLELSADGEDWVAVTSVGYKSFCANPDQVGFVVHQQSAGQASVLLQHWALS